MKQIVILVFSLLFMISQVQAATEISSGVLYSSGSVLTVPSHGIEFKVPDNWQAMLPQGSELMVMENEGRVARIFITSVAGSNTQAVRQILSRPQSLDAMTRLYPSAQVSEQDGLFSQNYKVTGVNLQNLVATAYGRLGENKTAVFVIMLEPENQNILPELGKKFIQSVVFSAPETVRQARAEVDKKINWERLIRGRTLQYTKTDDGRSIKKSMSLCSNGRFYYTEKDSFISKDAMTHFKANTQARQNGDWRISGDQLQLLWSDGARTQYNLSRAPVTKGEEPALFLDDERWLNTRNRACR